MRKQPSIYRHMSVWGFLSGFILADLYLVTIWDFTDSLGALEFLAAIFNPMILGLSLYGALIGTALGFLIAIFIKWLLLRRTRMKYQGENYSQWTRFWVYIVALVLCIVYYYPFYLLGFTFTTNSWVFGIIPIIGTIAALYTVNRYLYRLRLWNEQQNRLGYSPEKEKRKDKEAFVNPEYYEEELVSKKR